MPCFFFQSPMAALMASSASTEQWIFTGGSDSSRTMSVFLIESASATVLPFTHSVASDELAIAEPQPKVLNRASSIDRKSTRLNSSHLGISYAVFCLKKKKSVPEARPACNGGPQALDHPCCQRASPLGG